MGLRRFMVALVAALWLKSAALSQTQAPPTNAKTLPDWYVRGVTAALLDPTRGVLAEVMVLPRAKEALDAIRTGNTDQRKATLLKLAASPDRDVQRSAAAALAAVPPDNADQRKAVVEALLKLAASPDTDVQRSAAAALAAVPPDNADQRKAWSRRC